MAGSIKEIAKICGVSEGTVDRALNNRNGIKASTKERILEVANRLNYQPNHMARCLATGKTRTIGVVCITMRDSFFSTLLESIEAAAKTQGYFITLILSHNDIKQELDGIRYLINRGVDGLILFPVAKGKEYVSMLKQLNVPIVTIYNRLSEEFPHIDVDAYESMRRAVSFIRDKGYDDIAYLDVNLGKADEIGLNCYSFERRRAGYIQGTKEHCLEAKIIEGYQYDVIKDYITSESDRRKAILCSYDNLAVRVLRLCRVEGFTVPENVGLMGFNNLDILKDIFPRIYSVDCNIDRIGKVAFESLYMLMNENDNTSDKPENEVIEYSFSEGQTL